MGTLNAFPEDLPTVRLAVDLDLIRAYAEITQDFNPIHIDPAFAATTPMGGVIAHGTMSMNLLWDMLARAFGTEAIRGATLAIRFVRPVRVGDTVETVGKRTADAVGKYQVQVRNQDGTVVIEGTAELPAAPGP